MNWLAAIGFGLALVAALWALVLEVEVLDLRKRLEAEVMDRELERLDQEMEEWLDEH